MRIGRRGACLMGEVVRVEEIICKGLWCLDAAHLH